MKFISRFTGRVLFVLSFFFAFSLALSAVEVTAPVYDKDGYVYEDSETGASASREVTVVVTSVSGSKECVPLTQNPSYVIPYYLPTESVTYTATTDPEEGPYDEIHWGVEGGWTVSPSSADGSLSYTTQFQYCLGPQIIHVTLGESYQECTTYVFRPDIKVAPVGDLTIDEITEEDTGAYVGTGGEGQPVQITFVGPYIPIGTEFYLNYTDADSHNHLEINDGSGWVNFNTEHTYTYTGNKIIAVPLIRGTTVSDSLKDITLNLTTSLGSGDRAKVTVFDIGLHWNGMSDEASMETGLYVPLNDDDDNANGESDIYEDGETGVQNEDETRQLIFSTTPHAIPGTITLHKFLNGGSRIADWQYSTKKFFAPTMGSGSAEYDTSSIQTDTSIWVEGRSTSSYAKDAKYKISYIPPNGTAPILQKEVYATVFDIGLHWNGMSEEASVETGAYIPLNDDDDNANNVPDYQENPVIGENDLVAVTFSCVPADLPTSSDPHAFKLSATGGITLWEDMNKDTAVNMSASYTAAQINNLTYYVEGSSVSSSLKDSRINLTYQARMIQVQPILVPQLFMVFKA